MATNRYIIRALIAASFPFVLLYLIGCAELNLFEAPGEVIKHPLGTDPIRLGMSKDEVTNVWGKPDQINQLESTDEWKTPREEWVYIGRYPNIIPVDRSYLSKTKYLIFDGKHVVSIGGESQYEVSEEP